MGIFFAKSTYEQIRILLQPQDLELEGMYKPVEKGALAHFIVEDHNVYECQRRHVRDIR